MKKQASIAIALLALFSLAATADEVPKIFHGRWATRAAICTSKGPEAEAIVTVNRKGYQGYEISCRVKKITSSTSTAVVANGTCTEEGASSPGTIKLNLIDDAKGLRIGDEKYIRCGE